MSSNSEDKKEVRLQGQDWVFLVILVFLFLNVLIHVLGLGFAILFEVQIGTGMTVFSYLSFVLVFLGGIFWGLITFIRRYPTIRGKEVRKQFPRSMLRFIGIRKVNLRGILLIALSFFIGVFFNVLSNLTIFYFVKSYVGMTSIAITPYNIASFLVVSPIAEELTYRAMFIGFFLTVFGKNRYAAVVALIMSSFVFGFTHYGQTWLLLVKTVGGIMLGSIYLTRWGRNYFNSLAAHIGLNVIGIFTVIGI
jgi:membrane protease YdiL (CAAX protease family)